MVGMPSTTSMPYCFTAHLVRVSAAVSPQQPRCSNCSTTRHMPSYCCYCSCCCCSGGSALSHIERHAQHEVITVGANAKLHQRLSSSLSQQPLEGFVVEPAQASTGESILRDPWRHNVLLECLSPTTGSWSMACARSRCQPAQA
jgi:hypothetical protein